MRGLKGNAVSSYDGNRPLLEDAVRSDVSKSGITSERPTHGHDDLCMNATSFSTAASRKLEANFAAHSQRIWKVLRIDFCISLLLGSILWVPNFVFLFSFPPTSILGQLNAFYVSTVSTNIYWSSTNGPRTGVDTSNRVDHKVYELANRELTFNVGFL